MKILVCDKLEQEGLDILETVREFDVDCKYDLTPQQFKEQIKDYDALIVRSMTKVTADIIEVASRLKCIGRAGVGLDNVNVDAAAQKGIVVVNTPGVNVNATAEQTVGLMLALSRHIPQAHASMGEGKWDRNAFKGVELFDKTLGVIGLGRIGTTVAKICRGFGMRVMGYDPYLSSDAVKEFVTELVEFEQLLKESDYITLHVPKNAETVNLIAKKEFLLMKPTARLINCARGGVVNEADLAQALKDGKIAGAALDVYEQEPPDPTHPLFGYENCIMTPHLGAFTSEARSNVAIDVAQRVRDILLGKV